MKVLNVIDVQFVAGGFDDKTADVEAVEMNVDLPTPVFFDEQSNHAEMVEELIINSSEA